MEQPARIDWNADRYVAFIRTVTIVGFDFTGGSFAMQVRDRRDGGALRADLGTVLTGAAEGVRLIYAGTDTVTNHITAGRLSQKQADALGLAGASSLLLSQIGVRINKTTMVAMPFGLEIGDDRVLVHDMQLTLSGGLADVFVRGDFKVRAGVVQ